MTGGSQDGDPEEPIQTPSIRRVSTSPVRAFAVPKNRSTGNLNSKLTHPVTGQPIQRHGSLDTHTGIESYSSGSQSPVLREHEPSALAPSGLHRIRLPAQTRIGPSRGDFSSPQTPGSAMSIAIPPGTGTFHVPPTPATPLLTVTEDLTRFPAESLHSFSFAHHSDEFIQSRNNVIKRSIDFLRDRMGWAAGGFGIANAQAKVSGDQEAQTMMELLKRADVLGRKGSQGRTAGGAPGAITGPAFLSNENVFEKDFLAQSDSPITLEEVEEEAIKSDDDELYLSQQETRSSSVDFTTDPLTQAPTQPGSSTYSSESNPKTSRKRTYTDTAPVQLQNKLTDVLEEPYYAGESNLLSFAQTPTLENLQPGGVAFFPSAAPHAHGRGGEAQSQAIFTTGSESPWTITAANDLACLTFGVTNAELRKIGILELVREDKRRWLSERLRGPQATPTKSRSTPPKGRSPVGGSGVTAKLLSKPSSRETGQGRRTVSADGRRTSAQSRAGSSQPQQSNAAKSRGVLMCGDVLPILKRNGAVGSATFWVQQKRSSLIWVMEEIAEDIAYLTVDEVGCVIRVSGQSEAVWGMERVRRGMDITRLLPAIPRRKGTNTGALDYEKITDLRGFTARTANDISIPVTVDRLSEDDSTFRVSSFPYIAGMMVVSSSTLEISSSNSVVSETLFGRVPNGLLITELIPGFDDMLTLLIEEEKINLVEGMVIPEHSFRRARAMLALREGKADAAAIFLRPSGVPALHRDGAEIMIDVQMRVAKSGTFAQDLKENIIEEKDEDAQGEDAPPPAHVVYALWVSYSRTVHATNHGTGPVSPLVSRPGTPPRQPSPSRATPVALPESDSDEAKSDINSTSDRRPSDLVLKDPAEGRKTSVLKVTLPTSTASKEKKSRETSPTNKSPTSHHKKSIHDFIILEEMGAGAYGQVKLAKPKSNPSKKVVIKYVTKRRILVDTWTRDRRLGTVPLEIHVLDYLRRLGDESGVRHPNIVEMSDFFEDDVNYYIEMVPHGLPGMDLFDYIELRVNMEEDECRRIFAQVASAVRFLHDRARVVHRDIKDENVILDGEGKIKLIDFGSASYIKNGPFDVFVGTIDYAAPEVLAGSSYKGPAQDIWALGILLYTILYKENPFYSIDEIMDHDLRVPYLVSEESIDLVRKMLDRDVETRVDIDGVVAHPWIEGCDVGE